MITTPTISIIMI